MREISLITGQLHRAIYNLNEEARRTANQKFESGLQSATQRSLKKVFEQFRDSLQMGDSQVRRRTASLLVTLIRSYDLIVAELQPDILKMIEMGLADADPLVREATVESYSLLLEKVDEENLSKGEPSGEAANAANAGDAANAALYRIMVIAISDPNDLVREAAAVGVAVQKCETVQKTGVDFLMNHVSDNRYRFACRSIASLAEFPSQQSHYVEFLDETLNDSDCRFRRAALASALRLAKLESLPLKLLPNVTRRLFDAESTVAEAADEVVQTAKGTIGRSNSSAMNFLTECMWLAKQDAPRQHLPAILETELVRERLDDCMTLCKDRLQWLRRTRSDDPRAVAVDDVGMDRLMELADELVQLDGRRSIGWIAGTFVRLDVPND